MDTYRYIISIYKDIYIYEDILYILYNCIYVYVYQAICLKALAEYYVSSLSCNTRLQCD